MMRTRSFSLLVVLGVVVAACGETAESTTTTATAVESTSTTVEAITTTTPAPEVEASLLSYTLEPGLSLQYEVDLDQSIEMATTGDPSALGEDEDFPGDMSVRIRGTSIFTYSVSEGPEPGTFAVTITGEFSGMELTGTIDGEPADAEDVPEMTETLPVDVTVIVDEQGNVISDDSMGFADGLFGGLGLLDQFVEGPDLGHFIGPPFPDNEVGVGDSWSETSEVDAMLEDGPIVTHVESEVVDRASVDGAEVLVIETRSTTTAISFDLAEMIIGFMMAFVPEEEDSEELAEMEELIENLRFAFFMDETVSDMTTWFDAGAGVSRRAELGSGLRMTIDANVPDDTTGEMVAFAMDMSLDQTLTYRLIDGA
jgi:hypothetical protein